MAMSIFTNASSMSAINSLNRANSLQTISAMRMTSGKRINSASDDAAGMQIASRLNSQVRGMNVAMRNISDTKSMLKTAEGAFVESDNILNRMKDLATQAANDTNAKGDRAALQKEFTQLGQELKSILDNTSYSGEKLFATGGKLAGKLNFQTGAQKGEGLELDVAQQIGDLVKEVAQDTKTGHAADEKAAILDVDNAEKDVLIKKADYDKDPSKKAAWEAALTANKTAADALDTLYADVSTFESGVINLKVVGAQSAMRAVQELEKAVGTYGEMRS
ncbi:hypothetical protein CBW58_18855, partial [Yersinia frederiksenii]